MKKGGGGGANKQNNKENKYYELQTVKNHTILWYAQLVFQHKVPVVIQK